MKKIEEYLEKNWDLCIRENRFDDGTLLGLPYPYTVPSTEHFDEIYYWDTYFTNVGLIKSGKAYLAKNNVDNMLYLVDKYGFMPNGNRTWYLTRSQPPFLSEMVKDVYEYYHDNAWLCGAYMILEKEYKFWMEKRKKALGLNAYSPDIELCDAKGMAEEFKKRTACETGKTDAELAMHMISLCESGWDMNPRFDFEGQNFAAVDLNALLFGMENNMAYFAQKLGNSEDTAKWKCFAGDRLRRMNDYLADKDGIFMDYNCETGEKSKIFSTASYYMLFANAASREQAQAAVDNLYRLEEKFGIATCEKGDRDAAYQWDYPNGWACQQFIVMKGLENYGFCEEAKRIAEKYVNLVEKVFEQTGNLWEKYNVVDGSINVSNEYDMPSMMGWSAGVYIYAKDLLDRNK